MSEELFEVRGDDGLVRRGILTRPAVGDGTVAVLLLPAGMKYRVGPHRMNVKLARRLAERGYTVLRYDPAGLGESDGSFAPAPIADLWNKFESGELVPDVLLAAHALRHHHGALRVVAGGLCGGAIASQLAAARQPGAIDGVISIGTPVTLSRRGGAPGRPVSARIARHHFRGYLQKLLSRDAWTRVFKGETDFVSVGATVRRLFGDSVRQEASAEAFPFENPDFMPSFRVLESHDIPHLLIFGTGDNRWLEFEDVILKRYLLEARSGAGYETEVIPNANHELHLTEWQGRAAERILGWLEARFPVRA